MLLLYLGLMKTRTMEITLRHEAENLKSRCYTATNKGRNCRYMHLLKLWGHLSISVSSLYMCVRMCANIYTHMYIFIPNYCSKLKQNAKNSLSFFMSKYTKLRILFQKVFYIITSSENTLLIFIHTISRLLKYPYINYVLFFNFQEK